MTRHSNRKNNRHSTLRYDNGYSVIYQQLKYNQKQSSRHWQFWASQRIIYAQDSPTWRTLCYRQWNLAI